VTIKAEFEVIPVITNPPASTPHITGPASLTLVTGYAATSTDAFTITGTTPVTVNNTSGDIHITWNNGTKRLDIAEGLPEGVYTVTLRATNSVGSHTFTFTLTVKEPVYYIDIAPATGGGVTAATSAPYLAAAGETVTLLITPDNGYILESIQVCNMVNRNVTIALNGADLTRTFTMPAYHVTITATFRDTRNTDIEETGRPQGSPLLAYTRNSALRVSGLTVGELWSVYNISGTLIVQEVTDSDKAEVVLPGHGIYIVISGKRKVKIIN
jgi:hypothetical protein